MKLYLTRNQAAEILGVHPQTISNYVESGLLAKSATKDSNSGGIRILRSSLERLQSEGYDVIEQSRALDCLRADLKETTKYFREKYNEMQVAHKLLAICDGFHRNIHEICSLVSAFMVENSIINESDSRIVTEILKGTHLDHIATIYDISLHRVKTAYLKALRALQNVKRCSYSELMEENAALRRALDLEKAKTSALEADHIENDNLARGAVRIPKQLLGYGYYDMSVRLRNFLKVMDVENIYELALMERKSVYKVRNFGRKTWNELELLMEKYGIEFDNIDSLRNDRIQSFSGPFMAVPIYVLEQKSNELNRRYK